MRRLLGAILACLLLAPPAVRANTHDAVGGGPNAPSLASRDQTIAPPAAAAGPPKSNGDRQRVRMPPVRPAGRLIPAAPEGPVPMPPRSPMHPDHPMDRALVCMARALYFEARGQSRAGQLAVGHVIMNRVRHRHYPNTVCGVVMQGGRSGPCQFSWYCDRRSNTPGDLKSYGRLLRLALRILTGDTSDPTNGANMFHNTRVRPHWARVAQPRGQIGSHLFYYLGQR